MLHILTHRGGFPTTPASLPADEWSNWDAVVAAMENAELEYAPGQVLAYHPINYGWVIAELVQRIDGRPFSKFFQEELAAPLGMKDTYMGLPADLEDRVSKVHSMEDATNGARGRLANIQDIVEIFNRPDIHQATIPAAGGIGTARDLARYYSMIVNGGTLDNVQILKANTVEQVTKLQVRDIDKTTGNYVSLGLGLALGDPRSGFSRTTNTRTVCHAGAGTSIAWGDLDSGLSVAIICNGFRSDQYNVARLAAISQGIRNACL
jgi:CubicO group peptidase (beta-lactamase class C family)